jgi:hypothetical protein
VRLGRRVRWATVQTGFVVKGAGGH